MLLPTYSVHLDLAQSVVFGNIRTPKFAVPVSALQPDARQNIAQFIIIGAVADRFAQVRSLRREQTSIKHTVRRQSRPAATATESLSDRGNEADFPLAVYVLIAARNLALVVAVQRAQWPALLDQRQQFFGGYDLVHAPAISIADVHILNEANNVAGPAEMVEQIEDCVIVYCALDDNVDLNWRQTSLLRSVDACHHGFQITTPATHCLEHLLIETVQADGDPLQTGIGQVLGGIGKQHGVRRQRKIIDSPQCGDAAYQFGQFPVEQRLPACQPNLGHSERCRHARNLEHFVVRQPLRALQKLVVSMKFRLRHAIRATKVAAIQQGNTQVMQRPIERITSLASIGLVSIVRIQVRRHPDILPDLVALFFILTTNCCMIFGRAAKPSGFLMNLNFSKDELAFRDDVRSFFREEIPADIVAKQRQGVPLDRDDQVRFQKVLFEKGWAGYTWPIEYGGTGWTAVQKYIFGAEMADADAPNIIPFGLGMVGPVIYTFGSEEQKQRFLPDILASNVWWCQGYSEPGAGSDLASLKTRAELQGDHFIVNGTKTWTTLGQHADWIFCLARTTTDVARRQEGISFLLIDMNTPGVTVTPIITIEGDHEVNEIHFKDVAVPVDNLVGEEGKGWTYGKVLLQHERTGNSGVARTNYRLKKLRAQASQSIRAAAPLVQDRNFMRKVAAVEVELKALEITELRTLAAVASGKAPGPESSILKLKGTELQQATDALYVEAAGYYALPYVPGQYVLDFPVEDRVGEGAETKTSLRYFNFRKASIYAGSNEIQKNIIAKHVLGL